MCAPSGDHRGETAFSTRRSASFPSGSARKRDEAPSSGEEWTNATWRPSGDHAFSVVNSSVATASGVRVAGATARVQELPLGEARWVVTPAGGGGSPGARAAVNVAAGHSVISGR